MQKLALILGSVLSLISLSLADESLSHEAKVPTDVSFLENVCDQMTQREVDALSSYVLAMNSDDVSIGDKDELRKLFTFDSKDYGAELEKLAHEAQSYSAKTLSDENIFTLMDEGKELKSRFAQLRTVFKNIVGDQNKQPEIQKLVSQQLVSSGTARRLATDSP